MADQFPEKSVQLETAKLTGPAQNLLPVQARNPGDGGNHHAGEQLHGSDVALVEGSRGRGQDLEDPEGASEVAQR